MSLDPATVRRIATLARIHVDESQIAPLQGQLNTILGWIDQLKDVDVTGVEPLTGAAHMAQRLRADSVTDGGIAGSLLANAPGREGMFFTVPKVIE